MTGPASTPQPTAVPMIVPARRQDRRGPIPFLREEWPLLLLAAVLTAIIWSLVRADVRSVHTIAQVPVAVEVADPEWVAASLTGPATISLRLFCSDRDAQDVEEELREAGKRVRLRVGAPPAGASRPFSDPPDRFIFPFSRDLLEGGQPPPVSAVTGWVYQLVEQTLPIADPPLDPPAERLRDDLGVDVEIAYPEGGPRSVKVRAPQGLLGSAIEPDPILLRPLLDQAARENGATLPARLTFNRWRRAEEFGEERTNAARPFRRHLELPDVPIELRVHPVQVESIQQNAVYLLVNPDLYEVEIQDRPGLGFSVVPPDRWTGKLRARGEVLQALKRAARPAEEEGASQPLPEDAWYWGIQPRNPGDLPAEAGQKATLRARIVFIPPRRLRYHLIEFVGESGEASDFQIEVTRRTGGR